jgi:activator of 2-hydroxyglutaryl-CoA dehydratase
MITLGIDVGSLTTKSLILEASNILSSALLPTAEDASISATNATEQALKSAGLSLSQIDHIASTGIGKSYVPYPTRLVAEARCDIIGSRFLYPSARGVVDIGADNARAVKCDLKGNVVDFASNDKCAAGTVFF